MFFGRLCSRLARGYVKCHDHNDDDDDDDDNNDDYDDEEKTCTETHCLLLYLPMHYPTPHLTVFTSRPYQSLQLLVTVVWRSTWRSLVSTRLPPNKN